MIISFHIYNGDGLRSSKEVNGVATVHVWDGSQMVLETDDQGSVKDKYIRRINLLFAVDSSSAVHWYLFDAHGDVVQLTGTDGSVIRTYLRARYYNPAIDMLLMEQLYLLLKGRRRCN